MVWTGEPLMFKQLAAWELERATAIEVCIDELASMIERHGVIDAKRHTALSDLSDWLSDNLLATLGPERRYEMLKRVRDQLQDAYPDQSDA
jgi:hypothetical protein